MAFRILPTYSNPQNRKSSRPLQFQEAEMARKTVLDPGPSAVPEKSKETARTQPKTEAVLIERAEFNQFEKAYFALEAVFSLLDTHGDHVEALQIAGVLEPIKALMSTLHQDLEERFEQWHEGQSACESQEPTMGEDMKLVAEVITAMNNATPEHRQEIRSLLDICVRSAGGAK
jgi:hypothetical protein